MKIHLIDYPKFREAYEEDGCYSWEESLHNAGYRSADGDDLPMMVYELAEHEYTWFVLRWS